MCGGYVGEIRVGRIRVGVGYGWASDTGGDGIRMRMGYGWGPGPKTLPCRVERGEDGKHNSR